MNAPMTQPMTQLAAAVETALHTGDDAQLLDRILTGYSPRQMLEGDSMDKMMRLAEQMATSRISVPEHLRGNVGDCLAIITQAMLWNMNPFAVAQKTHIVSGRLGYEAQLVNAVVQNSGAVRGAPHYEYAGDNSNLECRVGFVLRGTHEVTWGEWLHVGQVTTKNSPLWKTNPKQQLGYLQLKNWARAFCPGAILGVYTVDELEDNTAGLPTAAPAPRGPQRKSASAPTVNRATGEVPPPTASPAPAPVQGPKDPTPSRPAATDTRGTISVGQANYLRAKLKGSGTTEQEAAQRYGCDTLEQLTVDAFDELKSELLAMG